MDITCDETEHILHLVHVHGSDMMQYVRTTFTLTQHTTVLCN